MKGRVWKRKEKDEEEKERVGVKGMNGGERDSGGETEKRRRGGKEEERGKEEGRNIINEEERD